MREETLLLLDRSSVLLCKETDGIHESSQMLIDSPFPTTHIAMNCGKSMFQTRPNGRDFEGLRCFKAVNVKSFPNEFTPLRIQTDNSPCLLEKSCFIEKTHISDTQTPTASSSANLVPSYSD